ncbi:phosphoglycerate dehydrogenase [Rothia terrae]|uniref:NAD(P)-dependent oxidoreductase n=1 Tax=Rothia terrae TaxID=396015 RepID=UPI001446DF2D|nr:NAD(P)-dependent oxidoreductase [Rothia terrae]MDT0189664.1 NAD(P)-dependent oxidoreductase [Rothia terrae]NKZ33680.1 phosphoglycerate dehydrogenase [Rothia terrae]
MKILVPTSVKLDESKLGLTSEDTTVSYDPKQPIDSADYDADVMIAWANTNDQLKDAAANLKDVKLVQALLAGPDQARAAGFRDEAVITSGSGLHSKTVAEHTLALTLNFIRFLPTLADHQERKHWASELGGAQELYPEDQVTTLLNANVTIWGFGSIGKETADLFKAFGANVTGVATTAGERHGYPVIATEDIDAQLEKTDVLVMILPTSDSTKNALNADKLAKLPKRSYVINVGRGTTVDEDALMASLNSGEIAGAALDVVVEEPLPEDSPLWGTKNIVITPHSAGGRPVNPEELIAQNLQAVRDLEAGKEPNWRNKM